MYYKLAVLKYLRFMFVTELGVRKVSSVQCNDRYLTIPCSCKIGTLSVLVSVVYSTDGMSIIIPHNNLLVRDGD